MTTVSRLTHADLLTICVYCLLGLLYALSLLFQMSLRPAENNGLLSTPSLTVDHSSRATHLSFRKSYHYSILLMFIICIICKE